MQIFGRKNNKQYIVRAALHGRFGPYEPESAFYSAHVLVRLLGEREGENLSNVSKTTSNMLERQTYGVRQNAGKMRKVSLVHGHDALGLDRPVQAVESRLVQVARLVVHTRHDGVRGVHDAADNEATGRTAGNVQRHALLHAQVLH